jgi:hypothetical protein
MKRLLAVLAALAVLAGLGWGSGILYWHIRIRSAMSELEQTAHDAPRSDDEEKCYNRAMETLMAAGCRILPYAVNCLDESRGDGFMSVTTILIAWESVFPGLSFGETSSATLGSRMEAWFIKPTDSIESRRAKYDRIRQWWKAHGSEHHRIWRFWTSHCRPYEPEPEQDP